MKLIVVLCAVISIAVALPSKSDVYAFDVDLFDVRLPISDGQIQCIRDGVEEVVNDNPELKWWFEEVEKSVTKLWENAKKCDSLSGLEQKRCYLKVKIAAQVEYRRLLKLLPADQKEVVDKLRKIIEGCLASS